MEAATLLGTSKTTFVEESAVRRAETIIAERQRIALDTLEFERFIKALDAAPIEVCELVELFSKPTQIPTS